MPLPFCHRTCAAAIFAILTLLNVTSRADDPEMAVERFEVNPAELLLEGSRDAGQLLVTGVTADGLAVDLTGSVRFHVPDFVRIDEGYVVPLADGEGHIGVEFQAERKQIAVRVRNSGRARPVSFRWETLAVLTKQGCNGGACHGKPNGRGALELSLNAFDPELDRRSLIRGGFARFTQPVAPEQSLLLKKPSLQIPHGGGKRLRRGDSSYEILRQWIAEGCHDDLESAPQCEKVEVFPARQLLNLSRGADRQQFRVVAYFSDGTQQDVTRLASYSLSNDAVARVEQSGRVTGLERGQTAVVIRYLDDIVAAQLTVVREVPGFRWTEPEESNYIDRLVHQKLKQLQFLPSEICDDATFLRRVSLDVRGLLPSVSEAKAFLADEDPDKRSRLIDTMLDSPEYARYWGLKWADLLRINSEYLDDEQATSYSRWVYDSVAGNQPYDQFARELITATGATSEVRPAHFYRVIHDTKQVAETVAQLFMGSRIQCAQCHNHPYESWTQDNYYQIAAAFHALDREVLGEGKKKQLPAKGADVRVALSPGRTMANPRTGVVQHPWPVERPRTPDSDLRQGFADWLTAPDNPYFARVAVNRIWAHLLGRGLVEPVDDFRSSNPAVNGELLDALAAEFVASSFDRKQVMRSILGSQTYQRTGDVTEFNQTDDSLFSHARVRLLAAEQIQDAISRVCEGTDEYEAWNAEEQRLLAAFRSSSPPQSAEETLAQLHAVREKLGACYMTQQAYPRLTTFLRAFGQPERKTACACERRDEASLDQALQLMNSELVRKKVHAAAKRLQAMEDQAVIRELYLSAFSREPTASEAATVRTHLVHSDQRVSAIEDVVWALINTNEFKFQH